MKKKVFGRHFSRSRKAREALFKSLILAFVHHGKIETSIARAKAIQGDIDKIVLLARKNDVASLRAISASLSADRAQVAKLAKDVASFGQRQSGFTRIIRLPSRRGDAAEMARIEWVDQIVVPKKEVSKVAKVSKVSKTSKTKKVAKKASKEK